MMGVFIPVLVAQSIAGRHDFGGLKINVVARRLGCGAELSLQKPCLGLVLAKVALRTPVPARLRCDLRTGPR